MPVGMPGTGLGGIFYLVLGLAMPFRELYLTLRGRSSGRRWGIVLVQLGFCVSIIAALWLEVRALKRILAWMAPADDVDGSASVDASAVLPALAAAPFILLGVMVVGLFIARWSMRRGGDEPALRLSKR